MDKKYNINLAKAKRKYKWRKEIKIKDFDTYYSRYMKRELNKSQLTRELKISKPTLDKLLKEHETKNKKKSKDNILALSTTSKIVKFHYFLIV